MGLVQIFRLCCKLHSCLSPTLTPSKNTEEVEFKIFNTYCALKSHELILIKFQPFKAFLKFKHLLDPFRPKFKASCFDPPTNLTNKILAFQVPDCVVMRMHSWNFVTWFFSPKTVFLFGGLFHWSLRDFHPTSLCYEVEEQTIYYVYQKVGPSAIWWHNIILNTKIWRPHLPLIPSSQIE